MDAIEQPVVEEAAAETDAEVQPALSVAEHAAQFGTNAKPVEEVTETPAEKTARQAAAAEQRREKETGRFDTGKVRHRAKSQQASPEDVPRIQALTGRAKAAEDRVTLLERELADLKSKGAAPAAIAKVEAKVDQAHAATDDPEPQEEDPKFAGDYAKFIRATAAWEGRQAYRSERQAEQDKAAAATKQQQQDAVLRTFAGRVEAARTKHADYDAVAFSASKIPDGSAIDAFIMEDESGAELLYHLQQHPDEVEALLGLSVLGQTKHLALLSQRFTTASPSSQQAGTTGSAAGRPSIVVLPPKPPNPVRTEAQRTGETPPPTDGSLSIADHAKHFGARR